MSDLENDKDKVALVEGKRKVMSQGQTVAIENRDTFIEEGKTSEKSRLPDESKKPLSEPTKKRSTEEIFSNIFSVKLEKNGDVKPAKITQTDLSRLCSVGKKENFGSEKLARVSSDAELTDTDLKCLTQIALHAMDIKDSACQKELFEICIRIVSGIWFNKHHASMDLYQDIFDGIGDHPNDILYMNTTLQTMFDKRTPSLAQANYSAQTINTTDSELEHSKSTISNTKRSIGWYRKVLERQKRNLQMVGVLWLVNKGTVDLEIAGDYFFNEIDAQSASKATFRDVVLYLANKYLVPEARFTQVVSMLNNKVSTLERERDNVEKSLRQREYKISQLEADLTVKRQEAEHFRRKITEVEIGHADLEKKHENDQLDQRAKRTHLRDNEERAKAKAINLLSEDVLVPLRLSLAALQREKPKTEVAAHQIELVLESIERDLQWFKK
jgi:prefoldin subunit 5